jgi:hypothetical protein
MIKILRRQFHALLGRSKSGVATRSYKKASDVRPDFTDAPRGSVE